LIAELAVFVGDRSESLDEVFVGVGGVELDGFDEAVGFAGEVFGEVLGEVGFAATGGSGEDDLFFAV
jgi:hypothetical protein